MVVTDYPDEDLMDNIKFNVEQNTTPEQKEHVAILVLTRIHTSSLCCVRAFFSVVCVCVRVCVVPLSLCVCVCIYVCCGVLCSLTVD